MGNSSSKHGEHGGPSGRTEANDDPNTTNPLQPTTSSTRARNRQSRGDFNLLSGFNPPRAPASQQATQPEQRRETRQEREARRLERERVAREKERERSMREEHVDGGFLVTMGMYKGREDFSKPVVRQLQIERKLAPFWRPLDVDVDDLNDTQLVYAARGLPVPEPDASLPPDLQAAMQSPITPNQSTSNLNLAVPTSTHGGQLHSAASEAASSNPGSALPSPTAPSHPRRSRGKAIAEALSHSLRSSRNNSQTDLSQRELALPNEPLVNGQPLEVALYRTSEDCPICFATYPNYLNYTRCCGHMICSECFVQIKRPDPHIPENHGEPGAEGANAPRPDAGPIETHSLLVSEPAVCPYCTQPEFGVTYEPPPFRRGLIYATPYLFGSSAMSSQTSLHSNVTPASPTSPASGGRRRGQSLSATAPNVVTTDRIRPDWALKLAAQKTTQARRAAAATALHQAAFIMYNPERQFTIGSRTSRFMRRNTGGNSSGSQEVQPDAGGGGAPAGAAPTGNPENDRLLQFEEVMMAEAIRLSLAAEEERRRKVEREAEKEAKKEAKRREKEDRKAAKAQKQSGSFYGNGQASTSRSSVSLVLGRRRGNSGASNLRMESTPELTREESSGSASSGGAPLSPEQSQQSSKGKAVDRGAATQADKVAGPSSSMAIPQSSHRGPSHLRQTSNISSLSSSLADSHMGSYTGQGFVGRSGDSSVPADSSTGAGAGGPESLFNFASMATTLGIDLDHQESTDSGSSENRKCQEEAAQPGDGGKAEQTSSQSTTQVPDEPVEDSTVTLHPSRSVENGEDAGEGKTVVSPEVRLIPGSPLPRSDNEFAKTFEHETSTEQRGGGIA
ncbi:related to regulator protein Sip5 [Cephalotrichum gorgonifer]|uniref:Related to regulator protein Sip5 n=1 Tax=Cephalotrichum gorgonifer TaxID=2041049 RepID=A0AAE8SY73_9PEZI|nr:related to regulator protein Sip5 [Cephalotrichum gorgonifer]